MKSAARSAYQIDGIRISSYLSKLPMIGRESRASVTRMAPDEIVPVLKAAQVEFVLVGAHGLAGWMEEPRATQDVDFLIRQRDKTKAAQALQAKFKGLEIEKHPDVWRFAKDGKYLIVLILDRSPLHKRVVKEFVEAKVGRQTIRVPKLEAALAMKSAAMTGHYRNNRKKLQDAVDFMGLVERNEKIDLELLTELGELVFAGGGRQAVGYVADVRAGRRLEI
ncbi:MAG: hypothetical protein M5U26_03325 [Planctomycetota bacterium]|nr:hypothetical protein [Planctomycetota bacterium]